MPVLTNPKWETFVQLVFMGEPASRAYRAAGYKGEGHVLESAASRLLRRVEIKDRLRELQDAAAANAAARASVDKQWVLDSLVDIAKRCMQAQPVLDRKGNMVLVETPTGEVAPAYTFNANGANRALELVGKEMGMFVERKDVTVRTVDEMTLDEVERELAALRDKQTSPVSELKPADRTTTH